jgi:hypothetical protein
VKRIRSGLEKTAVEAPVVRWARQNGIRQAKLSTPGQRGIPDRIFFLPGGRPCLVEFKRKGKKPTKLQAYTLKVLFDLGYNVFLTDDADKAIQYLERSLCQK